MAKPIKVDVEEIVKDLDVGTKKLVSTKIIGKYRSVFIGNGVEFEEYREYTSEDDATQIDWKASARANKTMVRQYKEERNLKIFFIVDTSESMLFGSTQKLKNEYTASLAASIAFIVQKAADSFGFALFNDHIASIKLPAIGRLQFYTLLKELADPSNYGGGFKLKDTLKFLFNLLEERSVVIIISDFIGINQDPGWRETLKLFARKFDTVAMMVRDPLDENLPENIKEIVLEDPYSGKISLVDPSLIRRKYKNYIKRDEENIMKILTEEEVDFLKLTTDKSFVPPIIDFFKRRSMRLSMIS